MTIRVAERRRYPRMPTAYPALLADQHGRTLVRGRAANASERGVLIIARDSDLLSEGRHLILHLTVPSMSGHGPRTRKVVYRYRIVRRQELGGLVGLGLEFGEKLA